MLVFATSNPNKVIEIKMKINAKFEIKSLAEINFTEDIPEPFDTIKANAIHKAEYIHNRYNTNCFAEDTGLCVNALNGEPGVLSARYAGPQKSASDNINLLLERLKEKKDRSAYFLTVIALYFNNKLYTFEGKVEGEIIDEKKGSHGFGYDPIFFYPQFNKTFAEINLAQKNKISHRAKATQQLVEFLDGQN